MTDSLQSYLLTKRSVDDRALNRRVLSRFERELRDSSRDGSGNGGWTEAPETVRVLEVGAGVGTMIARLAERELLPPRTDYHAVDLEEGNVACASRRVPRWLEECGYAVERTPIGVTARRGGDEGQRADRAPARRLDVSFAVEDLFSLESAFPRSETNATATADAEATAAGAEAASTIGEGGTEEADAVIAAALLDVVALEPALEVLWGLTKPSGLLYAPLTYDGITSFTPRHPLDDRVESLYNGHMDEVRERPGSSRAGRNLLDALPAAGYELIAAGGADWTVFPRDGAYSDDERAFLDAILETVGGALADYDLDRDHPVYTDWLETRRNQLAAGELGFVGHHLDVLARRTER